MIVLEGVSKRYRVLEPGRGLGGFVRSLVKPRYREIAALDNISLTVPQGQVVGYIGPNGAGKSTTIKIIAGIVRPSAGRVVVAGRDPFRQRTAHQLELGVVMGHRTRLFWDLPVLESLRYHAKVYRLSQSGLDQRIGAMARQFGIEGLLSQPVRQLSLGQRVRCDLALAFLHHPRVLLLDEPTIGLDFDSKALLRSAIRQVASDLQTTVILTSHDLDDVEALSDRIVLLDEGRVLYDGTLRQLRAQHGVLPELRLRLEAGADQVRAWLEGLGGVREVYTHDGWVCVAHEGGGAPAAVLARLLPQTPVREMTTHEPSIEEVLRRVYRGAR